MSPSIPFEVRSQRCWLSPERCLYWEEQKCLVVSDLHFGKTGHFRKSGVAVPQQVYRDDLHRLMALVTHFMPESILFTGDLFHSHENLEHDLFSRWRSSIRASRIILVRGNHDLLTAKAYAGMDIELHEGSLSWGPFLFVHDLKDVGEETSDVQYIFSGHIHPGIRISGAGRQSVRLPCFFFTKGYAVLPAFSHFTGLALIDPGKTDKVFAIIPAEKGKGRPAKILNIQ
jgi:DNA ligase-associated metallophosphoesterase